MALLPILRYPDPRLRAVARPVEQFGAPLFQLIDDMFETMLASRAIGLSAPQVNVSQRVVTIDVSAKGDDPQLFINPEIVWKRGLGLVEESCLSVPGVVANVKRAPELLVRAVDRSGQPFERELSGMLAVCVQHEVDHLEGKLFVDRLAFLQRFFLRGKLAEASQAPA
jgi:peptide deformylase